jgi:hypothetical protein
LTQGSEIDTKAADDGRKSLHPAAPTFGAMSKAKILRKLSKLDPSALQDVETH